MPTPKKPRNMCLNCGKKCNKPNKKYCNTSCHQEHRYKRRASKIKQTGVATAGWKAKEGIKIYIINEKGHQCEICKKKHWCNSPIPLVLDHIDGNSSNWEVDNLRLVCSNCDAQLPTYKSKNKGNGRYYRRQRYAAGKSY